MAKMARQAVLAVLAITLVLNGLSCGTGSYPFITAIAPTSVTAGGGQFQLTVNGDDFRVGSVVQWNGFFVVTTFVSTHQLLALIPPSAIAKPGTVAVLVFNLPGGRTTIVSPEVGVISTIQASGRRSNAVLFTVNP